MIELNKHNRLPAMLGWYWLASVFLFFILPLAPIIWAVFNFGQYIPVSDSYIGLAWGVLVIYLLLVAIAYLLILLRLSFISFVVTNNEITIASGILARRFKSISFDQVQDVDITVDIFKSIFTLGDINIWTASQSQTGNGLPRADAMLALYSKDAEWLKNFILDNRPGA